jgi:hypothetical protein
MDFSRKDAVSLQRNGSLLTVPVAIETERVIGAVAPICASPAHS